MSLDRDIGRDELLLVRYWSWPSNFEHREST